MVERRVKVTLNKGQKEHFGPFLRNHIEEKERKENQRFIPFSIFPLKLAGTHTHTYIIIMLSMIIYVYNYL